MKNLAKVHYKEVNGKFIICKFEGFKTMKQVEDAYGFVVMDKYVSTQQRMYGYDDCVELMGDKRIKYSVNQKMDKESFDEMIDLMKEAGHNLVDSIKKAREPEIKIIEI
jgi:hypothetical protein